MSKKLKYLYILTGAAIFGYYTYSAYYGIAIFESRVERNTAYKNNRVYRGYGNYFHHK